MALCILDSLQRRLWHRFTVFATHQIRGQNQRGSARNYVLRHTFRFELVHLARTNRKGPIALIADQGETAANRSVHTLKIVKIHAARSITKVTIRITANLNVIAHHAQQYGTVVRQHGEIVQRVANRAACELVSNQFVTHQFSVQRFCHGIVNDQRMAGTQPIADQKGVIDFRFDIDQRLSDAHYPTAVFVIE